MSKHSRYCSTALRRKLVIRDGGWKAEIVSKEGSRATAWHVHCHWCRKVIIFSETTVDHVVPLADGGAHEPANMVPSCKPCNDSREHSQKGA